MKNILDFIRVNLAKITFLLSGIFIIVLRFIPIRSTDLLGDGALNSFRAFGWFDWLGFGGQSTPFEWFGGIPFWAKLSFHDAPPLAFLIQRIFFFFGSGVVIARLPFVLAGVCSVFLVYVFIKKITDSQVTASLSAILYSVVSYSIWAEHSVYLEGIQAFFILGSVIVGAYTIIRSPNNKHLYLWVLLTSFALITKYTAIFLLPPIVIYVWLYRKQLSLNWKNILISIILFSIVISPVVIYNYNVYKTRGHFDAALSSMVGMHPDDFEIISERGVSGNPFKNFPGVFITLSRNISYPLFILFLICIIVLIWQIRLKGFRTFEAWIITNLFFLTLMFAFAPAADRFVSIIIPFAVTVTSLGVVIIANKLKENRPRFYFLCIIIISIFLGEFLYSFNTNVLRNPVGKSGIFYSENKLVDLGFNELDDFIRSNIIEKLPSRNIIKTKDDIVFSNEDIEGRSVIVFDDRIYWFGQMWYMQRYFLYYRWPFISTSYFIPGGRSAIRIQDILAVSGKPLYFVYPVNDSVIDAKRNNDESLNSAGPLMAKQFDSMKIETTIISNSKGEPTFKIYKIIKL